MELKLWHFIDHINYDIPANALRIFPGFEYGALTHFINGNECDCAILPLEDDYQNKTAFGPFCYIIRAWYNDGLQIGYVFGDKLFQPIVSWGGREITLDYQAYELFCPSGTVFIIKACNGNIPSDFEANRTAVPGGFEANGEILYLGLGKRYGLPGKVSESLGGCNVAVNSFERCETEYAVIIVSLCSVGLSDSSDPKDIKMKFNSSLYDSPIVPGGVLRNDRRFLINFTELLNWKESEVSNDEKLPFTTADSKNEGLFDSATRPIVMHCHDMKGGYNKDADKVYLSIFSSWDLIDLFCYFSHHRVTIPPKSWIEVCQANNVPCIGTIITEGKSGFLDNCMLFDSIDFFVDQLASMCNCYGFHGYLINFESPVKDARRAVDFITLLTLKIKNVLGKDQGIVIYYDSLRYSSGKVCYQNCLNENNMPFFSSCDGILTNYVWDKRCLDMSLSETTASNRFRVLMGIDMFGRHTPYHPGIGANGVNWAVSQVLKNGLSVGLFAPAWTIENGPSKMDGSSEEVREKQRTLVAEFWQQMFPDKANGMTSQTQLSSIVQIDKSMLSS